MANVDRPHGFMPVADLNGGVGYVRNYHKAVGYATAIGKYDFVNTAGAGTDIEQDAAGSTKFGVSLSYGAASTATVHPVYIAAETTIFEAQTDLSLVTADEGLNADSLVAAAQASTGLSQMEINSVGEATTNTLDLNLLRIAPYIDNASGTNSRWFCVCNNLQRSNQLAGI